MVFVRFAVNSIVEKNLLKERVVKDERAVHMHMYTRNSRTDAKLTTCNICELDGIEGQESLFAHNKSTKHNQRLFELRYNSTMTTRRRVTSGQWPPDCTRGHRSRSKSPTSNSSRRSRSTDRHRRSKTVDRHGHNSRDRSTTHKSNWSSSESS